MSIQEKIENLKSLFASLDSKEARYEELIDLGKELAPLSDDHLIEDNLVPGCQSLMYIRTYMKDGSMYIEAFSDALISKGLVVLLIKVYSGEKPETILKTSPTFFEELSIHTTLSPSRANGFFSMYTRLKQDALKNLIINS